jgi:hypothetical protein
MMRRNVVLSLGADSAGALDRWTGRLASLQSRVLAVETDNRLDRHEWLRLADGRLLKADALDHVAAHDLVGAQDVAWDVAGAAVEFDLTARETAALAAAVGRRAERLVDPELLEFMTAAYQAFRIGQARLSAEMCAGDAGEAERWRLRATTLENKLQDLLQQHSRGTTRGAGPFDKAPERTAAGTIVAHQG